jgi:hypothetical protein
MSSAGLQPPRPTEVRDDPRGLLHRPAVSGRVDEHALLGDARGELDEPDDHGLLEEAGDHLDGIGERRVIAELRVEHDRGVRQPVVVRSELHEVGSRPRDLATAGLQAIGKCRRRGRVQAVLPHSGRIIVP